MRKSAIAAVIVVATMCSGSRTTASAQPGRGPNGANKSPVLLLAGYRYREGVSVDSQVGRIWKQNGPVVDFDIGRLLGNSALTYAERVPKVSTLRLAATEPGQVVLAMDFEHNKMVVSIGYTYTANFMASNVKSREDVAEVLAMIRTYRDPLAEIDQGRGRK